MRYEPTRRQFVNHNLDHVGFAVKRGDVFVFEADGLINQFDEDDLRKIADKLEELNGGRE